MKKQKQAVIDEVKAFIPSFRPFLDNALTLLTKTQVDTIKNAIYQGIINGSIDYSKDRTNQHEVLTYARGMVMNHLKKTRELTGGTFGPVATKKRSKSKLAIDNIQVDSLPEELKEYVDRLKSHV